MESPKEFTIDIAGVPFRVQTGKIAKQSRSAVVSQIGETVVLNTICFEDLPPEEDSVVDFNPFLHLTVEYREMMSAAGKFPPGFFKREGKPSLHEVLVSRDIDRPIRPLIYDIQKEIQIISNVYSVDKENPPDVVAMNGVSIALLLSPLPIRCPVASVRVIAQNEGNFVVNPTHDKIDTCNLELVVSGTKHGIVMVEGRAKEVSERTLLDAINYAYSHILKIIDFQENLLATINPEKISVPTTNGDTDALYQKLKNTYENEVKQALLKSTKKERNSALDNLYKTIIDKFTEETPNVKPSVLVKLLNNLEKDIMKKLILEGKRLDGRKLDELRPISCEVGILPRIHGSALFTRGETQALATITLGTRFDQQIVDDLLESYAQRFMLHYNFLPFSVGEVKRLGPPSRRELGHGILAERALTPLIPSEDVFPYTIRVVSDILESNGSSSMATVCGGSLALMDAGVPIKCHAAGIAMGLFYTEQGAKILSDIIGAEDKNGDMDFKVAGTRDGITAFQLDTKTDGVPLELLEKALKQAREGRLCILDKLNATIDKPRPSISQFAPKIVKMNIPPEKIGILIGPAGKNIKTLQNQTGTVIEIEQDGTVFIHSQSAEANAEAKKIIEEITEDIKIGKIYKCKVIALREFGAFVEVLPSGTEGFLHVSEIANTYISRISDYINVGEILDLKVIAIDENGKLRLSKKQVDDKPILRTRKRLR